jgi:hypothetical protein
MSGPHRAAFVALSLSFFEVAKLAGDAPVFKRPDIRLMAHSRSWFPIWVCRKVVDLCQAFALPDDGCAQGPEIKPFQVWRIQFIDRVIKIEAVDVGDDARHDFFGERQNKRSQRFRYDLSIESCPMGKRFLYRATPEDTQAQRLDAPVAE